MLFPLPRAGRVTLVRERLRFPVDAALLSADGTVLEIVPLDDSPEILEPPVDGVLFVLEARRGAFAARGAARGSAVTLEDGSPLSGRYPAADPRGAGVRRVAEELLVAALAAGGTARLVVSGGCMEPLLEDGDVVEVAPLPPSPAGVPNGAILLARGGSGALVCHRKVGGGPGVTLLAGDRSRLEELPADSLHGVVVGASRGPRRIPLPGRAAPLLAALRRRRERGAAGARGAWLLFRVAFRVAGYAAWLFSRPERTPSASAPPREATKR